MSDGIGYGGDPEGGAAPSPARRFVPMRVGEAVVYVEEAEGALEAEGSDGIYAATSNPEAVFDEAVGIIKECVSAVGEQVTNLGEAAKPSRLEVEFSLTFEAKGRAQVIPVILTGETKGGAGLKVTAVWGG